MLLGVRKHWGGSFSMYLRWTGRALIAGLGALKDQKTAVADRDRAAIKVGQVPPSMALLFQDTG